MSKFNILDRVSYNHDEKGKIKGTIIGFEKNNGYIPFDYEFFHLSSRSDDNYCIVVFDNGMKAKILNDALKKLRPKKRQFKVGDRVFFKLPIGWLNRSIDHKRGTVNWVDPCGLGSIRVLFDDEKIGMGYCPAIYWGRLRKVKKKSHSPSYEEMNKIVEDFRNAGAPYEIHFGPTISFEKPCKFELTENSPITMTITDPYTFDTINIERAPVKIEFPQWLEDKKEIERLNNEIKTNTKAFKFIENRYSHLEKENEVLKKEIKELKSQLKSLCDVTEALTDENKKLIKQNTTLLAKLNSYSDRKCTCSYSGTGCPYHLSLRDLILRDIIK